MTLYAFAFSARNTLCMINRNTMIVKYNEAYVHNLVYRINVIFVLRKDCTLIKEMLNVK